MSCWKVSPCLAYLFPDGSVQGCGVLQGNVVSSGEEPKDADVSVVFCVDTSGSMDDCIHSEKKKAEAVPAPEPPEDPTPPILPLQRMLTSTQSFGARG